MTPNQLQRLRKERANKLYALREATGISKLELKRMCGLETLTILRMERGDKCWTVDAEIIYTETLKALSEKQKQSENSKHN